MGAAAGVLATGVLGLIAQPAGAGAADLGSSTKTTPRPSPRPSGDVIGEVTRPSIDGSFLPSSSWFFFDLKMPVRRCQALCFVCAHAGCARPKPRLTVMATLIENLMAVLTCGGSDPAKAGARTSAKAAPRACRA